MDAIASAIMKVICIVLGKLQTAVYHQDSQGPLTLESSPAAAVMTIWMIEESHSRDNVCSGLICIRRFGSRFLHKQVCRVNTVHCSAKHTFSSTICLLDWHVMLLCFKHILNWYLTFEHCFMKADCKPRERLLCSKAAYYMRHQNLCKHSLAHAQQDDFEACLQQVGIGTLTALRGRRHASTEPQQQVYSYVQYNLVISNW